ncbi:hypothetical protein F0562_004123 [Nyssa sinensis]|uniref:Nudix hydrolase domain-containing protein n=1 Tax=Nyssa sinensis TaxID=561372 RepID=A0A5J5BYG6_9ASTE|nr:hypothetical protein F0562_004123 [Nyssa sinensis]
MELENMVALVSRTGRHLQLYKEGCRQVVGCIPYRYRINSKTCLEDEEAGIEVLVISSQKKGKGMLFPKGGWERDESIKDAALRETMEEAGVSGVINEPKLGQWKFKSRRHDVFYEGHMFPLLVKKQLEFWPEKDIRQRVWMSVSEAKEACQHGWMKEALEKLEQRLRSPRQHEEREVGPCSIS